MAVCWLNGTLVPPEHAKVSVFDHGLLYGDGVFEGIRFYNRHPFRLDAHLQRLELSARAIHLDLPYDRQTLASGLRAAIAAYGATHGYIRLVVTRGEGKLGIDPASCGQPTVFALVDELALVPDAIRAQGARLMIAATRSLAADGLDPRVKSLNYLNRIMARLEASAASCDEAILLNDRGMVSEGTAENIFVVKDGHLSTPPPTDGALAGITRSAVIEIAAALDIPCQQQSLSPYDLYTADECFLTGTGAELIPVQKINGRPVGTQQRPIFAQLQTGFAALIAAESAEHAEVTALLAAEHSNAPARAN